MSIENANFEFLCRYVQKHVLKVISSETVYVGREPHIVKRIQIS